MADSIQVPVHFSSEIAALEVMISDKYGRESDVYESVPITPIANAAAIAKRLADQCRTSLEVVLEPESASDSLRETLGTIFGGATIGALTGGSTERDLCVRSLRDTPEGQFPIEFAYACRDMDATFRGVLQPIWNNIPFVLASLDGDTSREINGARVLRSEKAFTFWIGVREIADALDRAELYKLIPDKGWDDFTLELRKSWSDVKQVGKDVADRIGEAAAGAVKYTAEVAGAAAHGFLSELGIGWIIAGAFGLYALSTFGVL